MAAVLRRGGGLAFPLGTDVDGHGIPDLLRYDLAVHSEFFTVTEGERSGSFEYEADYTWTVGLVSGADSARGGSHRDTSGWSTRTEHRPQG